MCIYIYSCVVFLDPSAATYIVELARHFFSMQLNGLIKFILACIRKSYSIYRAFVNQIQFTVHS